MEKGDEITELRCHTPFCESYRIARNFCLRKRSEISVLGYGAASYSRRMDISTTPLRKP